MQLMLFLNNVSSIRIFANYIFGPLIILSDTAQEVVRGNGREVGAARDAAVVAETDTRRNTGTASQTEGERKFSSTPCLTSSPSISTTTKHSFLENDNCFFFTNYCKIKKCVKRFFCVHLLHSFTLFLLISKYYYRNIVVFSVEYCKK